MPDKLSSYRQKRDFQLTPEPQGKARRAKKKLRFVVQKHAARRLHYDFRLELSGSLKSWAIPKGPSLDPGDKRLAVHVEDHPLEYADFEGVIPPKQYGAGKVIVWDRGEWLPQGDPSASYKAGKLKFELKGEKLSGGWTLVRTRLQASGDKEQWLLIKERDSAARAKAQYDVTQALPDSVLLSQTRAADTPARSANVPAVQPGLLSGAKKSSLPKQLAPQLATLVESVPDGESWNYEVKFDGYRLLARVSGKNVNLYTRNGHDWSNKLPAQVRAIKELRLTSAWLDGEIVVLGKNGAPSFQALQNAFDTEDTEHILLFLFDLPYLNGYDLRASPLHERRAVLHSILENNRSPALRFSVDFVESPYHILAAACKLSLEGVIGKRRDAPYVSGRSKAWIKLKCRQRQEFIIGGFTAPQGSRSAFGALLLGVHDADGHLRYAGRVGTGFDDKLLRSIHAELQPLKVAKSPFVNPPRGRMAQGVQWLRPMLVAEVSFAQWTEDDIVRQAVFHGLRIDKPARKIGREETHMAVVQKKSQIAHQAGGDVVAGVAITHPHRVIDQLSGVTKIELAHYYEMIAAWLLPHLKARPVALLRAPEGIDGEQFFQKHMAQLTIPKVRILDAKLDPGHAPLMVIDSTEALVGAAQMGTIELHTWNAIATSIERPDRIVFDLDPDPSLPWSYMVEAANLTKALLDELGLKSFVKTSGGKGLHLLVPLAGRHSWDGAKRFSQAVAEHLAATIPARFSAKMGPKNRIKKIFVDYLRNHRGASTVAAYSARARPGISVSTPIDWDELAELKGSDQWTIRNLSERMENLKQDPWEPYRKTRQSLSQAAKRLGLDLEAG